MSDQQDKIMMAARWLSGNRGAVEGATIPFLRSRFSLTNLEAIEATKLAHALTYGGAHGAA